MKNDQEGGIKTDHFLTLDFYYNRGRGGLTTFKKWTNCRELGNLFSFLCYTQHTILSLSGTSSTLYLLFLPTNISSNIFCGPLFSSPSISQRGINWLRVGSYWGPKSFKSCEGYISVSSFSRCLNGTFPWRNCSIKALVHKLKWDK